MSDMQIPSCLLCASDIGIIRGELALFQGIDIEIKAGEAVHLRGRNGSGKTTLLRILAGLTRPDAGTVERFSRLHWIGHLEGLKPHETPRTHLSLWAKAWGSDPAIVESILSRLQLSRPIDVPARLLSAGQRRRAALARLLLDERPLWLLDEPNAALDTEGQMILSQMVMQHIGNGGAVISALHGAAPFRASREITL